jgi:hypothetical protein
VSPPSSVPQGPGEDGPTVRGVCKLTAVEKNEYQERTGEDVFFATEQEFDEAILALPYDEN